MGINYVVKNISFGKLACQIYRKYIVKTILISQYATYGNHHNITSDHQEENKLFPFSANKTEL